MAERKPEGMSWEDFSEQKLREAFDSGLFKNLPGQGQPIPGIDEPLQDNWWIKKKLRSEQVSVLPPLLEARRDIEQTREELGHCSSERVARQKLEALRDRVRKALDSPLPSPPVVVLPIHVEEELERWRLARTAGRKS
jgi:hypothetical protein